MSRREREPDAVYLIHGEYAASRHSRPGSRTSSDGNRRFPTWETRSRSDHGLAPETSGSASRLVGRDFVDDRGIDRSAALAYVTLLSLVPLLATVAALLRAFFPFDVDRLIRDDRGRAAL